MPVSGETRIEGGDREEQTVVNCLNWGLGDLRMGYECDAGDLPHFLRKDPRNLEVKVDWLNAYERSHSAR